MKTHNSHQTEPTFIGIDYHKRYSVFCVIDAEGAVVQRGRIEHAQPGAFVALVNLKRKMELSKIGQCIELQGIEHESVITWKIHLGAMGIRLKSDR